MNRHMSTKTRNTVIQELALLARNENRKRDLNAYAPVSDLLLGELADELLDRAAWVTINSLNWKRLVTDTNKLNAIKAEELGL